MILAESILRRIMLHRVLTRTHLDEGMRFAVARITGYVLLTLGFYLAFTFVGIDLSSLAVLAGAIGVGLGFGLQNIVNNFISGIIILAERPIAIGDRVEVNGVAGQVTRISLRSTVVVTNDNISVIVPNSSFISEPVVNWSHGDPKVRINVPVGIAYGSDVEKFRRLMMEVALAQPEVLRDPPPNVFFIGFGESSLDFEVAVWTAEMLKNRSVSAANSTTPSSAPCGKTASKSPSPNATSTSAAAPCRSCSQSRPTRRNSPAPLIVPLSLSSLSFSFSPLSDWRSSGHRG